MPSNNLDAVLARLADFREAGLELKDRVTTALLYPAGLAWSRLDPTGLRTCGEVDAARAAQ